MSAEQAAEPVVTVRVGGETYGIPVDHVREVLRDRPLEPIAGAPGPLAGMARAGEERIPVLDLRSRFGVGGAGEGKRLVVVRHPEVGPLALRVDDATTVRDVSPEGVRPVPSPYRAGQGRGVRGLARLADGLMILLDVANLLSPAEEEAVRAASGGTGEP